MRKSGFTLIEILIVIAIVAILAGILVPRFGTSQYKAHRARALADMEAIKTASHLLYVDTGYWPPEGANGYGLIANNLDLSDWDGPYLKPCI